MTKIWMILAGALALGRACGAETNVLMRLPFDGTAEASLARGERQPLVAEGLVFGPGRFGKAVRLTEKARSRLAYAVRDNLDFRRGSMSFWLKREARPGARAKAILELERDTVPGQGRFSFAFARNGNVVTVRDDTGGRTRLGALGVGGDDLGVWQHWVVTWGVRDSGLVVYCGGDGTYPFHRRINEEESGRFLARKIAGAAKFTSGAKAPERFFLGCGATANTLPVEGWLDEVTIYDRQLSSAEVQALFETDRRAAIVSAIHFGLADGERTLSVEIEPRSVSLERAVLSLADARGRVVASAPCTEATRCVTLKASLPAGAYSYRLEKGGELLARDSYTVLRADNPYELPSTDRPGEPLNLRFVKCVKPDLATLTTNDFRAIGKCRMGTLDGATYLEGGLEDKDRFAVRFSLPTNRPLYLVDIVYPDDKFRTMDLVIQAASKPKGRAASAGYGFAQGLSTGGEFPNTMKMMHHRCLYWSGRSDDLALIAMAWMPNAPAAVSELLIYEVVDGALPVAKVAPPAGNGDPMGRTFGQFWEDPNVTGALRFNMATPESFGEQINRYAAMMRYCGQNILSYPGAWYRGLITAANDPRKNTHVDHFLEGYYAKFEREGLYVMPSIEFIHAYNPPDVEPTFEMVSNGTAHATFFPIQSTGLPVQRFHHDLTPVTNFFHPETQREIEEMIRALVREGAPYKSFKGVSLQLYRDGAAWWGDITSGYNDYCIEAFEREAKVKVRGEGVGGGEGGDPLRGKAYYETIMADPVLKAKWVAWRCDKFTEFYARMAKILTDARSDLRLWFIAAPQFDAIRDLSSVPDYFSEDFASRTLREAGLDGAKIAKAIPNAIVGVTVHPQRHRKRWYWGQSDDERRRYLEMPACEGYYREIECSATPYVTCRDEFMEYSVLPRRNGKAAPSLTGGWLTEIGWRCSTVNASDFNAMRYFAVPLRFGDVLGFTRGSFLVCDYGYEPLEARFAQSFRALPDVKMSDWPFESDRPDVVRVRSAAKDGHVWYYAVNTEAQPATASFDVATAVRETRGGTHYERRVSITLAPYELRSFSGETLQEKGTR